MDENEGAIGIEGFPLPDVDVYIFVGGLDQHHSQ